MTPYDHRVADPMTAPALRWGILGPGNIAHRFAEEVQRFTRGQIVAVGSRDGDRAQRFIAEAVNDGDARAYGSYDDLLADDTVEAVYVATPHAQHHDVAIAALNAGKPVLVEKAFCLSARQAQEVFAVADRRRLFAMEAMWSRFLPHYALAKSMLADGELGAMQAILATHAQSLDLDPAGRMMNPALGGGALLDLGIYPLSLFHWLWGVPDEIIASGVLTESGVDLRESITCRYGDRMALAYTDMGAAGRNGVQIIGAAGRLQVADWFYTPQDMTWVQSDGDHVTLATQVDGGFQYQVAEAARCIAAGRQQSEIMSWQATIEVLTMTDSVRQQLGVVYPGEDRAAVSSGAVTERE
ncbi:MAG: Gfo/Idh/MocA family oxidoreductase [Propionibacteriaceae bacterium]|nr:Gfo/Idh/MocA family oxidoreductase [Propionibacteriaceae bacterium]